MILTLWPQVLLPKRKVVVESSRFRRDEQTTQPPPTRAPRSLLSLSSQEEARVNLMHAPAVPLVVLSCIYITAASELATVASAALTRRNTNPLLSNQALRAAVRSAAAFLEDGQLPYSLREASD